MRHKKTIGPLRRDMDKFSQFGALLAGYVDLFTAEYPGQIPDEPPHTFKMLIEKMRRAAGDAEDQSVDQSAAYTWAEARRALRATLVVCVEHLDQFEKNRVAPNN